MKRQLFIERKVMLQTRLREAARVLVGLINMGEFLEDVPGIAQKVRGVKRDAQELRQDEAIGNTLTVTARVLAAIDPGALEVAAAVVRTELADEAHDAQEALEASEEADESAESSGGGVDVDTLPPIQAPDEFDGVVNYVVIEEFEITGTTDDPADEATPILMEVGQEIGMTPEDAAIWLELGAIKPVPDDITLDIEIAPEPEGDDKAPEAPKSTDSETPAPDEPKGDDKAPKAPEKKTRKTKRK